MKSYDNLKTDIEDVNKEISYLYTRLHGLKKELQGVCLHENTTVLNGEDYSGVAAKIECCTDCKKMIYS